MRRKTSDAPPPGAAPSAGAALAPATSARFSALGEPRFRSFWLGSLAAVGGVQLMTIALGWLVYELSGSPLDLGLLGASLALPTIALTLFGGVLADRLDKRKLLIATSGAAGALLLLLALLDATETARVGNVLAVAALIGLVTGLDWPARGSIFPSLIERRHMMSAVALNSILWQATRMAVPALGGMLIAVTGTAPAFLLSAAGFACMVAVLRRLRPDPQVRAAGASLQQIAEGIGFIVRNRLFAVLIPLTWVSMFFATSFIQIMPAFADLLGVDERGFGALVSAFGVGSVGGTLIIGTRQRVRWIGRVMLLALAASALALSGFAALGFAVASVPGAFYWALLAVALNGLLHSVFLIASMTVLQLHVPDTLRGRVMGIHGITFSLIPLGGLFTGALAAVTSPPLATWAGAAIVLAACAWVAATQAEVRDLDGTRVEDRGQN